MLLCPLALAADPPVFSVTRDLYDAPFELTLAPSAKGGTVYVSTSWAEPDELYTGPITIDRTTLVRAQEVDPDGSVSEITTHTYVFVDDVLTQPAMDTAVVNDPTYGPTVAATLRALPTISMVGPMGLTTAEQELSWEWIDPEGPDQQVDLGARLVGGHSIVYQKNSIRLAFRSRYGTPKLHLDLYGEGATGVEPANEFDALTLRGGNHDSVFYLGAQGQYLRNLWMDETQLEMGHLAPHGRFAHLYLNAQYRGLYHVRERFNAAYLAEYLGGDEEDYEAINGGSAFDGSGAAWGQVVANRGSFAAVTPWLNVPNFLDYMVLNFYAGNAWDWSPDHNWIAAGPIEPGRGGFRFHSSDSDICLYYDATVNVLSNGGPSYLFSSLLAERHPDFLVALMDALHRNLEDGGPLTPDATRARYARLAGLAHDPVVAESARWGSGWWRRDEEWVTERDRLLDDYFPVRTDELLRQVRAAGWYPLGAPAIDTSEGVIGRGATVALTVPDGPTAELWLTTDGEDPRAPGGAASTSAQGPLAAADVTIDRGTVLSARLRDGDTWGPLARKFYELDEPPPLLLNEWNAVDDDEQLEDDDGPGEDLALGTVPGNGGDWLELLVLEDGLDLRGWRITMEDRNGAQGELRFTEDALLAALPRGALFTIAEDLPEDGAFDPDAGDWRFHLRAGAEGSGRYVTAAAFDVTHRDWTLTLWDADGHVRFGPVGETVAPSRGLGASEVGHLAADPTDAVRRWSADYAATAHSSFGAANQWGDERQDLSILRGVPDPVEDTGVPTDDTAADTSADPTGDTSGETSQGLPSEKAAPGCGCSGAPRAPEAPALAVGALLAFALLRHRRRLAPLPLVVACAGSKDPAVGDDTGAPGDSTEDSSSNAESGDTSPMCWQDVDRDGYGDPGAPTASCAGASDDPTDCDDNDRSTHPGAPEVCDGLDNDCDGATDDEDDDVADPLVFYPDGDGDGWGAAGELVYRCTLGEGTATSTGDCDDSDPQVHPGAVEDCDEVDQDCDGQAGDGIGASAECAAASCLEILEDGGPTADGAYWIAQPSGEAAHVWCDMSTDGGGWTVGFLRNTAGGGSQGGFGAGEVATDSLGVSPADTSASTVAVLGWIDLNALEWTTLRVAAYLNGGETYLSRDVPRDELRIDFGEDGYLLYGGTTGYYWCGGRSSYTDAGAGAVNNPSGAPADCKGHGSLGSGWDFSESTGANAGLTLCGGDGSSFLAATWGGTWIAYGTPGGAQAIWVR